MHHANRVLDVTQRCPSRYCGKHTSNCRSVDTVSYQFSPSAEDSEGNTPEVWVE
jgi:hypothetical protein